MCVSVTFHIWKLMKKEITWNTPRLIHSYAAPTSLTLIHFKNNWLNHPPYLSQYLVEFQADRIAAAVLHMFATTKKKKQCTPKWSDNSSCAKDDTCQSDMSWASLCAEHLYRSQLCTKPQLYSYGRIAHPNLKMLPSKRNCSEIFGIYTALECISNTEAYKNKMMLRYR